MSIIDNVGEILNNGYQVIPIATKGKQAPLVSGHLDPTTEYTQLDAKKWIGKYQGAGIALCGGKNNVYALDFDIDDEKLSKQVYRVIIKHWTGVAVRKCNHPRFAVLFRAKGDLLKYTNAHSIGYKTQGGELNQIELIGNRIITIYGKHRKSGKPYKWSNKSPIKTNAEDLPQLDLRDIQKIFKFFEDRVPDGYKKVSKSTFSKPREESTFDTVRVKRVYADHEVSDLLERATGNDRKNWIEVGMALHAHYEGSKEGLHIWDEWSSKFEGYEGTDDCRYQWKSFKSNGGITLSTIENRLPRKVTKKKTDPEDELENVINNLVYIEKTNEVAILGRSSVEAILPLQNTRNSYSNKFVDRVVKDKRNGKEILKPVNVVDIWWTHPDKQLAHDKAWIPMDKRIIHPDYWNDARQMVYVNEYVRPNVNLSPDNDLLHYFIDHVDYIFPGNRDLVLNWMAQIVQKPWERHRVALYSICTNHGTGRGWLVQLMSLLYGSQNVSTIGSMGDVIRPNAKNGYLYNKVLCTINEVSCRGNDKHEISDRLKTLLSDNTQAIDIKWGKQDFGVEIFTRMFLSANGIGDMVIDEDDVRFTVCISHAKPKERDYYVALYKLLDIEIHPDFLNQVYTFLSGWKVDISTLQAAPVTKDKLTVIRANKSETALAFYEFKLAIGNSMFTNKMLNDFLADHNSFNHPDEPNMSTLINKKQLDFLHKDQIITSELKQIKTKLVRINSFAPHDVQNVDDRRIVKSINAAKQKLAQYFTNITKKPRS